MAIQRSSRSFCVSLRVGIDKQKIPLLLSATVGGGEFHETTAASLWQQIDGAGALHFPGHLAVKPSRKTCHTTRDKLAGFTEKTLKQFRIAIDQLIHRDVHAAAGHPAIVFTQGDEAFGSLRLHERCGGRLANLAVQSAALEIMIEFNLLKPSGSIRALFVACADVAGWGLAFGPSLRAFQGDNFSCHKIGGGILGYSLLKSSDSLALLLV